jgi:hypothetical protein
MELTVHIPDDIAERFGDGVNDDLSRRVLEALLADTSKNGGRYLKGISTSV